ncbi:exopolysaccharide biosynthesis protein [Acuticoccus sp.]|uniref:exopolysaccharide biosynthesis protein n=1 Tax=Acuticoccus sp. TaxID=1904378 RepID=UPI003B5167E2
MVTKDGTGGASTGGDDGARAGSGGGGGGDQPQDLVSLLDRIKAETEGDTVSMGDIVEAVGRRSFGPLFIVTSLLAILPTGAIPGMSVLTGTIMLFLSVQLLFGANRVWLPGFVEKRGLPRDKLVESLDKVRPRVEAVGRYVGPRLEVLLNPPVFQLVAIVGVLVSLSMYPLAVVPFGAFPAGVSLLVIGLGLTVRDGLVIAIGLVVAAVGLAAAWYLWPY